MNILIVGAHPDDDALGCGGLMNKARKKGINVNTLIMNSEDGTRYKGEKHKIIRDLFESNAMLGVSSTHFLQYTDSEFHNESHRKMVEAVESAIQRTKAEIVITHHPSDNNSDHEWTFKAVVEAFRIGQRGRGYVNQVKGLYLMEVQSSSDWGVDPSKNQFTPNVYEEITEDDLNRKIESLKQYENVIREYPHPRSEESIKALAMLRGTQCGKHFAEAFQCVYMDGGIL